ncbi:MAG: hypothetical protein ACRDX8_12545 [Acidimicrobiales bacterium]
MASTTLRDLDLGQLVLKSGAHSPDGGFCVMEAVAYVAGEEWSDRPECASPVISAFLRNWNDCLGDEDRQMLKPLIPRLVGTRGSAELELRRSYMALDWLVRVQAPAWLRLAKLETWADQLRDLGPLTDAKSCRAAQPLLAAVGAATGAATWAAGRDATGAAAWDAAWDATGAATWAATWDATGAAGRAALRSTVVTLQESAMELVSRMIETS